MDTANNMLALGSIKFLTGPLAGDVYQIRKPSITIGREAGNDIVIRHPSVSRRHAQLSLDAKGWTLTSLATQNTMTVNQRDAQQAVLQNRDTIGLGGTATFLFLVRPGIREALPLANSATEAAMEDDFALATILEQPDTPGQPVTSTTPTLEVSSNIDRFKQTYQLNKPVMNIGRDQANDIVINRPTISAFHAQIVRDGDQLYFVHPPRAQQKTTNGITYQGKKIPGNQQFRKALTRGDMFRITDDLGTFVTLTYNGGSGAEHEITPEIHPIQLNVPMLTIGRLSDNTIVLAHPLISGRHARLEQYQDSYRIIDQNSTNGVYVNGERVNHHLLKIGDEIRMGPYRLTFTGTQLTQQDESSSIRIDVMHLKKMGNKDTILIDDISLVVPPRKFVALVGGSGAGKSTLMDAINGLRPAQEGAVLYNGQDYYRNLAAFSTQLGYVPQEDIIHRDLTVERALYYAARLRLPDDLSEAQIKQRVNEVLEDVEMKHRRSLLVSKLSGGQRKRVSIALELLANPNVFFLDEPTSGLDPGLDRKMMLLLRKLADQGHTIVLVTHATNNINACDYVCFLCQGGRLAYYGPPNEAKAFFGKTDFSEIYSALEPSDEEPNIPAEAEERYRQSKDYQKYIAGPLSQGPTNLLKDGAHTEAITPPRRGNPIRQFSLLFRRYIELLRNDVGNLLLLLLQAPIIAILLWFMVNGNTFSSINVIACQPNPAIPLSMSSDPRDCNNALAFFSTPDGQAEMQKLGARTPLEGVQKLIILGSGGDVQKILFIMAFAAALFGIINGIREIVKEVPIYKRERAVNLGILPYMFSKVVVLGALCVFQSLILVLVVGTKAPFRHAIIFTSAPIVEIYISMCLTSLAGLMLGLAISATVPNTDRAMSFVPIVLVAQVIFSGIIFALDNIGLQIFGALFAVRWSMAAMGSTIGLHIEVLVPTDGFTYKGTLLSTISQADATSHLLFTWSALVIMIILFGIVIAYSLKKKDVRA